MDEHYYVGVVQENAVDTTIYFYTGIDPFAVVRPSEATGVDFEGRIFTVDDDQPVHIGARCFRTLLVRCSLLTPLLKFQPDNTSPVYLAISQPAVCRRGY